MSMNISDYPPAGTRADEDLGPAIIISSWTLTAVSLIFLSLRIFGKVWTRRDLWIDDYMLIGAWVTVLIPSVLGTMAAQGGQGKHVWNVNPAHAMKTNQYTQYTVTVIIVASMLSKTSFSVTVLRLVQGWMKVATWFIIVSMNLLLAANILLLWVNYAQQLKNGMSNAEYLENLQLALADYAIFVTAYSAAMDFCLVFIGWMLAASLKMRSLREKIGVAIALSMGVIAGVTSIAKAGSLPALKMGDITYASAPVHMWSIAEPAVTIIAASIPLLRVLFVRIVQVTAGSRPSKNQAQGSQGTRSRKMTMSSMAKGRSYSVTVTGGGKGDASSDDEDVMLDNLEPIAKDDVKDEEHAEGNSASPRPTTRSDMGANEPKSLQRDIQAV